MRYLEKKAVIAYIQGNRGVITVPELAMISGLTPAEAEERITAYCVEFGGSPEATEDGTVVYRFDDLLLRADRRIAVFRNCPAPLKGSMPFPRTPQKQTAGLPLSTG